MSGEGEICSENTLERRFEKKGRFILEKTCGSDCPCRQSDTWTHLNVVRHGNDGSPVKYVNIRGREEHEALVKDSLLCDDLGLDQTYEIMVYLKRWGGWLSK
jgi:hypothetical protein